MDNLDFVRCQALNNIPQRKLQATLQNIEESQYNLSEKALKKMAVNRYAESNIPLEYWSLRMDRNFKGDPRLLIRYNEYTDNIKTMYESGGSICFAGGHGLGKTMTIACILKWASLKGYSCLYTTLSDVVSVMTTGYSEDRAMARRELVMVDFLAIDEYDPRFMPTENAADLYARSLESVFRARSQNKLPTLMGTNSPNPVESFNGPLKASIDSLTKGYLEIFTVLPGKDFRKMKEFDWQGELLHKLAYDKDTLNGEGLSDDVKNIHDAINRNHKNSAIVSINKILTYIADKQNPSDKLNFIKKDYGQMLDQMGSK